MRWYIAHSYKHREEQAQLLDSIITALQQLDHEPFLFTRAYQNFGLNQEKIMMQTACKEMDGSDGLIAEVSSKEIGVGLEIGYFAALKKPIIYLRKTDTEYSSTVGGVATTSLQYESIDDAVNKIKIAIKELTITK